MSRVKVKDRCGKVLYVKSYNDKLNVMVFQYNDDHNTERVISNSTVGYGRLLETNDNERGRISRWWIEYDDNGYVISEKFHSLDNSPVGDANGIYGRTYVRDEKGRPVEIHYIGIDGKPQSTKWGLGVKKFEYDEEDNWVKAVYLTIDGKPAYDDSDGVAIYSMEYDEYGNIKQANHLNGDGKPMLPKKNYVSGVRCVYNDRGLTLQEEYLDVDGKPIFVRGTGISIIKYEYDDNGYITKKTFCDPSGRITDSKEGNAIMESRNDVNGNPLETWFKNSKGELCETTDGYAGVKQEYDSIGNLVRNVYYGIDKKPTLEADGTAGFTLKFNEQNLLVMYTNLGKDLKPAADKNNMICCKREYDKRGNIIKVSYLDANGTTLREDNEGIAGWNNVYDEKGNQLERKFFDKSGKLAMSNSLYYAWVKYTYDDNSNLNSIRYYNTNGNLTLVNGIAGTDYINDKRGNTLEEKPIGINGGLATSKLISKYKYDQFDNQIEMALYGNSGAATNIYGVHRYEYVYNSRNQLIEQRHYGKDGNLTINSQMNCAIEKHEYDNKGDLVKMAYFDSNNKPCCCKEGWSSSKYEHDNFGNVTKQSFFGVDGKPTDPSVMPPVGIAKYDKWGNMIYLAAQDSKGNLIETKDNGWAICRMQYDKRNNCIETAYFDVKEKATLCKENYHKAVRLYDNLDRKIEESYYGKKLEAISVNGYHKEVLTYDKQTNNLLTQILYDNKGKAVNCDAGWHKCILSYDSDGNAKTRKYYSANGTLLSNQVWNGQDWEIIRTWQTDAYVIASQLPESYGPVTVVSLKITGDNSCELTIRMSYTRSQLDSSEFDEIKEGVKNLTKGVEEYLGHKPYVTSKLYDKNGTLVYTIKV